MIDAFASSTAAAGTEEVAAVTATIDMLVACFNAGDFARTAALFTDDYWRREIGGVLGKAQALSREAVASPVPVPPEAQQEPVIVGEVRVLSDGRLGAVIDFGATEQDDSGIDLVAFERVGDQWLIDEVVTDIADELGTPAPSA